jgi:hypothetical protein
VTLYNGSGGGAYGSTINLSGTLVDSSNGFGFLALNFPSNGLQNGSPDGLALVNGSTVVQFLSYEGSFTATDGPANGLTSTDIGVSETSATSIGDSLQLSGTGAKYSDFTWASPAAATPGAKNGNQTFTAAVPDQGSTLGLMALALVSLPIARKLHRS